MPPIFPFESMFLNHPSASCLLSADGDAVILAANAAYLRVTCRSIDELLGKSVFEAFPGDPEDGEDSGVQALHAAVHEVLRTGLTQKMCLQRYPIKVTLPDGSSAYEERYWSAETTPIFNDNEELAFVLHVIADVSERVLADVALSESESRMRAFITATADVVYRMSPDWAYMHGLDGRGFLKTTTSWAPYQIEEYVHAEDVELARAAIRNAIETKGVFELEHRVIRVDGTVGWTFSKAIPLLSEDGAIREWLGTASDITQRKLTELELRDADRRKDNFLAMLAHELRNPLAPINSAAELLPLVASNPSQVLSASKVIGKQVRHLSSLVEDLLDVSRVTSGMVELERHPVNIADALADAHEQVWPHFERRSQRLKWEKPDAPLYVSGDHKRLVQVLTNLLHNASKYSSDSEAVAVTIAGGEENVRIEVQDSGVGIEQEFLPYVFELFAQSKRNSARSEGGLGLGLSLVKNLVELHGGAVSAESAGPNLGSRFIVTLPLTSYTEIDRAIVPTLLRPNENTGALRFLVVDDNVDAAEIMADYVQVFGHIVDTVHDVPAAIALADTTQFDVCLLDIGLPGDMDGNDLARKLRTMPNTSGSLMIAVTGYGSAEDRAKGAEAGFDHYFVKPVKLLDIIELSAKHVRIRT
jgi:signal transduction histidine kinase